MENYHIFLDAILEDNGRFYGRHITNFPSCVL